MTVLKDATHVNAMIAELNVMINNNLIREGKFIDALAYITQADQDEVDEFESMKVSEAVDYVFDMVQSVK